MKRKLYLVGVFAVLWVLTACQPALKRITPPLEEIAVEEVATTEVSSPHLTPLPTSSPEPVLPTSQPSATYTAVIAPSVTPAVLQWLDFSVEFANYTQVVLEFNLQAGSYYGEGVKANGESLPFRCSFKIPPSTELVCRGAPLLSGESMNFMLYDAVTGMLVYRNRFSNIGAVPTPAGMVCEVEPQWNNQGHELGQGCFAISCYLNGVSFYGNNNTCEEPWPFEWDYYHPLSPLP